MGRKRRKFNDQKIMDDLGAFLLEDAVGNNSDEALDLLEKCMIPVGIPPIPWRGIVFQLREKRDQGADIESISLKRSYNLRFVPMIV